MTAARAGGRPLRVTLLAVITVGLVVLGGGLAIVLGIGRGAATPTADSVDAGFARDMADHHLQGVEMANLAPERSQNREVRQLAFDISSTQTNQAGRMQGWLSLWGIRSAAGAPMAWMGGDSMGGDSMGGDSMGGDSMGGGHAGHTMASGELMPGMATTQEMADLRGLSGAAFDVHFLRLMIRHHQGGLEMAEYAAEHADVGAVRVLSRTMAETQSAETRTMIEMLAARGGTPLPAP